MKWISNNACGLKDDKLLELAATMERRNVYLALVSETDRPHEGLELVEVPKQRGWFFLGFNDKKGPKDRRGVGIVLSPRAHKDWLAAGGGTIFESSRNLAIRLENGSSSIVVESAYPE